MYDFGNEDLGSAGSALSDAAQQLLNLRGDAQRAARREVPLLPAAGYPHIPLLRIHLDRWQPESSSTDRYLLLPRLHVLSSNLGCEEKLPEVELIQSVSCGNLHL